MVKKMEKKKVNNDNKNKKKKININVSYDDNIKLDKSCKKKEKWHENISCKTECGGGFGFFYFLAIIGAAVYYISNTSGFWNGVLAILKAFVWPAFLIFEIFKFLGA
jgi:hypothetical protein